MVRQRAGGARVSWSADCQCSRKVAGQAGRLLPGTKVGLTRSISIDSRTNMLPRPLAASRWRPLVKEASGAKTSYSEPAFRQR